MIRKLLNIIVLSFAAYASGDYSDLEIPEPHTTPQQRPSAPITINQQSPHELLASSQITPVVENHVVVGSYPNGDPIYGDITRGYFSTMPTDPSDQLQTVFLQGKVDDSGRVKIEFKETSFVQTESMPGDFRKILAQMYMQNSNSTTLEDGREFSREFKVVSGDLVETCEKLESSNIFVIQEGRIAVSAATFSLENVVFSSPLPVEFAILNPRSMVRKISLNFRPFNFKVSESSTEYVCCSLNTAYLAFLTQENGDFYLLASGLGGFRKNAIEILFDPRIMSENFLSETVSALE